jgi:hypothetical protein
MRYGTRCDHVRVGNLSIEASTVIFDPYKLAATGTPRKVLLCHQSTRLRPEDFQDMNQVTRRGSSWRNLVSNGEDKSIEFSDGPYNCVAIHKAGTPWRGGYVYMCTPASAGPTRQEYAPKMSPTLLAQHKFGKATQSIWAKPGNDRARSLQGAGGASASSAWTRRLPSS